MIGATAELAKDPRGLVKGKCATIHWASFNLLPYFGATGVNQQVLIGKNLIPIAGVTAAIDGALPLAAILRGHPVAQQLQ
jgi:cyclohexyl-isocyanide hydratase